MPERVEALSGEYFTKKCANCKCTKLQFVQSQQYLGIGGKRVIGVGNRTFMGQCVDCSNLQYLTLQHSKIAQNLRYKETGTKNVETTFSKKRTKYYPVLKDKRREKIRLENRKEGLASMGIGLVIGLVVIIVNIPPWTTIIGSIIILYSILGGLYGIFEDPERKHRTMIDHNIKL